MKALRLFIILAAAAGAVACTSSPTGRSQLIMVSDREADRQGNVQYRMLKEATPRSWDPKTIRYVNCIANEIVDVIPEGPPAPADGWEVTVFDQDSINAFALPGGNIGVFTGIMEVTENQDQLAAVIGHEVAHVIARHSAERMTMARVSGTAGAIGGAVIGVGNAGTLAALGLDLPFGRKQEDEADLLGLDYMAQAGFDPRAAVSLWKNMRKKNPGSPPEFLSTHPSSLTRIDRLTERMPRALAFYEEARAAGKRPQC
jgi:predicted Zn-dependent protease